MAHPPDSETPFKFGDDDPNVQAYRLRLVEKDVKDIKRMVYEIHTKQATIQTCPKPGACIKLEEDVNALKGWQSEQKGAWKVIVMISAAISVLIGVVTDIVFRK